MLSSGMFACTEPRSARRHARLPGSPRASTAHFRFSREGSGLAGKRCPVLAPARRGGAARPCASSVLSAPSALSVLIPALLTIRPRMVNLRSAATKGRSTFIRAKIDPLFSYNCALFHFPYPVSPAFATLTKTAGVWPNSSRFGTRHSALILLQLIQVLSFHTLAHSFVQWALYKPFVFKCFRTLSIATGVCGVVLVCLTKGSFQRYPGIGPSCFKAPVSRFDSQVLFLVAFRNLLLPPSVFLAKCQSTPTRSGSQINRRRPL